MLRSNFVAMYNILRQPLPPAQYMRDTTHKGQIYLHHTVSGDNVKNVVDAWAATPERVGAHLIVSRTGDIYNVVPLQYWLHHLGLRDKHLNGVSGHRSNVLLNANSIAIELTNWGPITQQMIGGKSRWINHYQREVDLFTHETVDYGPSGYRGYRFFEAYPSAQIKALRWLLRWLMSMFDIPAPENVGKIAEYTPDALRGKPGIYAHSGVRPDKSDIHPQPELIAMLSSLTY